MKITILVGNTYLKRTFCYALGFTLIK